MSVQLPSESVSIMRRNMQGIQVSGYRFQGSALSHQREEAAGRGCDPQVGQGHAFAAPAATWMCIPARRPAGCCAAPATPL